MTINNQPINNGSVSTIDKVFTIITLISQSGGPGLGVTKIARECEMPKATTHRILKSLTAIDVLHFDDVSKQYTLGPSLLSMSLAAQRQLDVPQLALPFLQELSDLTLETATLSMRQGDYRIYLDQVPSPQEIKMTVVLGTPFPLYAGASSRAILAAFSEIELDDYLSRVKLDAMTENTILDQTLLKEKLNEVREQGFSVSRGERQQDAASVAAAVIGSNGRVFGSISISGPLQRIDRSDILKLGRVVKENANRLSARLGHRE